MTKTASLRFAVCALLAVSGGSAFAGNVPTEMPGLLNFHEVHPFLYRGGGPSEKSIHDLKEKGVKTIIDLRAPSEGKPKAQRTREDDPLQPNEEKALAEQLGIKYVHMTMDSHAPTRAQVHTFIDAVEKSEKGDGGPVYLHCAHGSDRTGCLVGIWRVTHDNFDYDQAYQEMRKYFFNTKFTKLSDAVKQYADDKSTHVTSSNKTAAH
ncbi:MAG TPA: tyrosine-protein phosphatase [Drouetiella sp.]